MVDDNKDVDWELVFNKLKSELLAKLDEDTYTLIDMANRYAEVISSIDCVYPDDCEHFSSCREHWLNWAINETHNK